MWSPGREVGAGAGWGGGCCSGGAVWEQEGVALALQHCLGLGLQTPATSPSRGGTWSPPAQSPDPHPGLTLPLATTEILVVLINTGCCSCPPGFLGDTWDRCRRYKVDHLIYSNYSRPHTVPLGDKPSPFLRIRMCGWEAQGNLIILPVSCFFSVLFLFPHILLSILTRKHTLQAGRREHCINKITAG